MLNSDGIHYLGGVLFSDRQLTLCLMESGPIWLREGDFRSLDVRHFCKSLSDATPGKIFECLAAKNTNAPIKRHRSPRLMIHNIRYHLFLYRYKTISVKYRLD